MILKTPSGSNQPLRSSGSPLFGDGAGRSERLHSIAQWASPIPRAVGIGLAHGSPGSGRTEHVPGPNLGTACRLTSSSEIVICL